MSGTFNHDPGPLMDPPPFDPTQIGHTCVRVCGVCVICSELNGESTMVPTILKFATADEERTYRAFEEEFMSRTSGLENFGEIAAWLWEREQAAYHRGHADGVESCKGNDVTNTAARLMREASAIPELKLAYLVLRRSGDLLFTPTLTGDVGAREHYELSAQYAHDMALTRPGETYCVFELVSQETVLPAPVVERVRRS